MRNIYFILIFSLLTISLKAENKKDELQEESKADSNKLSYFFKNGEFGGHARFASFYTNNSKNLSDSYAMGVGMGIDFESAKFYGFQMGISGFFIYNIYSSDLTALDSLTNQPNRYEVGLFDIENPNNRNDLDRLEDLYLKYSFRKSSLKIGKQHLQTPFINLQDGRMRPSLIDGLTINFNEINKIEIEGGYIISVSPRSTVKWYEIEESMSIYGTGVNSLGKASNYKGNIDSKFIAYTGVSYKPNKSMKLNYHIQHVDNIMNSQLLEADYLFDLNTNSKLNLSAMYVHQSIVNNGGNDSTYKRYFESQTQSNIFSTRIGYLTSKNKFYVNYTRITDDGKYLMPREWGRDPFYTFMSRERNEGLADVHALTFNHKSEIIKNKLSSDWGLGYYDLPDVKEYAKNKYGLPSYVQLNIDLKYKFDKFFEGLSLDFIYVQKFKNANTYNNDKYVINKVDLTLFNIIANYRF